MPIRMVLFDIDGTLLVTRGAGRRALHRAFGEVFGAGLVFANVPFKGRTDPQIIREMAQFALKREIDELEYSLLCDRYLAAYADEIAKADGYEVMRGVEQLLSTLQGEIAVPLGLETGNIERGAKIKLERGRLNRFFRFGGFGSDSEHREEIIATAIRRGVVECGISGLDPSEVCVVGDAQQDILAGKKVGARTVAVRNGLVPAEELLCCAPDVLLEDFTEISRAIEAILR